MAIRYIKQKDINYALWDRCINNSFNGVIYAYSWYIDIVAEHWDALVEDDYRIVMPLIIKRNIIFRDVYTPALTKQLGLFSAKPIDQSKILQFIDKIPALFRKVEIFLNRQNSQTIDNKFTKLNTVFELDLITPYSKKINSYSTATTNKLAFATKQGLTIQKGISMPDFDQFLKNQNKYFVESSQTKQLRQILTRLLNLGRMEVIGVYNKHNELVAGAFFVRSNHNVILFYGFNKLETETVLANYVIIDTFLKSYSGRNVTLSMEHFDKYWTQSLYTDFSATPSLCASITRNKLPFFLRWL